MAMHLSSSVPNYLPTATFHVVFLIYEEAMSIEKLELQYCAKVMQKYFAEICGFSWHFDEKILNF